LSDWEAHCTGCLKTRKKSHRFKCKKGDDLGKNSYFNLVLGSRPDYMIPYFIPKWEITLYILKGFEKREMRLIFGKRFGVRYISPETLDTRFKTYYGTRNFYKIKLKLLKPILDRCLRFGYLIDRTLSCLIECGIEFVKKRKNKRKCLTNFLIKIYGDPGGTNKYRRIREQLFVKPYTNHLKRIKIRKRMIRPTILRDYLSGRYLKRKDYDESNWSIIEYLFARNCSPLDIANGLNLCSNEDSQLVRNKAAIKIKEYLRSRWRYSLKRNEIEFNYDNLRKYLQSFEHEKDIYNKFISINKA